MSASNDALKSLHTTLIDSRNGYDEALADAEGKGLTSLFRDMIARRENDISKVATLLSAACEVPDSSGSLYDAANNRMFGRRARS